ncbi:MAG: LuxR C-terminal-related transcriptional regulator [Chloroflexi bacterium]|nr:LuxR C-terminal-related transcriptional regulator [Chloroflexota bacterium]
MKNENAVAWYALDPSDDDSIPFGAYLIASLEQALGPTTELAHVAQLLRASPEIDLQRILQSVINAIVLSEQDCALILDDYHLITSPAIHSAVTFLLEHLPENMRVVIGSRSDPPLPLARMRAGGYLIEIRAASLRFTADETELFLNQVMKLDLSPEGITALEARTEGWIAGLQLAALSLSGRSDKENFIASFAGSHRYLVEYLLEEVVNRQPQEVQSFLLSTSILERMCAPLCDAIMKDGGRGEPALILPPSSFILEHLERANLFVLALDDQGDWFRYHHLFRDFLQTRLLKDQPERVTLLHRAASEWLAAHNFLREAAQHAFLTHDWDYAAAFVERHSFTMIVHSEISTIYEWCSTFPEEVMQTHPMLCILQCWPWVFRFRRQNRPRIEERLQQAEQVIAAMEDRQQARELTEHAAVVRTFLVMAPDPTADPRKQLALAQSMLRAYPEGDAGQFSALLTIGYAQMALHDARAATQALETARQTALRGRLFFGIVESTFHLARLAHSQGRLRHAAELCRQGQADVASMLDHPERELPALGCLDIALGCVLLEQDQLEGAEEHLLHGLDLIGMGMNPYYLMTAYVALARLHEIQNRPGEAARYLARLEETWPDIAFCTDALRVTLALRAAPEDPARLAEATTWRQSFSSSLGDDAPPGIGPFGAAEVFYLARLAWVRAQIAIGDVQAARPILERQLDLSLANGLTNRMIELSLLEALAGQAGGDDQRTWKALERALVAAQPEGYLRIFDQGLALTQLLVQAANGGLCRDYIGRILAAIGSPQAIASENLGTAPRLSQASGLGIAESLSERELEVLRLMAQGDTNQAIAEQLVITVGTVKSHINHILGKLDSHNRTEAVARARRLGLV